jgi:hypothetical protein
MHPDMALVQGYETLAGKRGGGGLRKIHEIPSISQTSLQKKKLVMKYLLHGLQGFENWIQNRGGDGEQDGEFACERGRKAI